MREKSITPGLEHVDSLVRRFTMKCPDLVVLPHILHVYFENRNFPVLITVRGRPPMCLKCNMEGHIRRDCTVPTCRHCKSVGHSSEDCAVGMDTWASRLKKNKRLRSQQKKSGITRATKKWRRPWQKRRRRGKREWKDYIIGRMKMRGGREVRPKSKERRGRQRGGKVS